MRNKYDPDFSVSAEACRISAYWNTAEVQLIYDGSSTLVDVGWLWTVEHFKRRKIALDFTDADTLHNATLAPTMPNGYPTSLDGILATWIANFPISSPFTSDPMDENWRFFDKLFTTKMPTANYTAFRFITREFGYGYEPRSTSVYLSIAVLLLYCIIVAGYIIYTLVTGSASTAWSSGVELMTLALQSKRPDHLGHTGVGIDSLKTLRESVGIRVNTDNEVELVFAHDRDFETRGLRKLERNAAY
jgi:hypothetical protein